MSISSTGLYGSATIVNTDIFDDLLTLKEEVTALSTVDLTTTNEHRIDILQNKQDITDKSDNRITAIEQDITDISNNRIVSIEQDITDISNNKIPGLEQDITDISNNKIPAIEEYIIDLSANLIDLSNNRIKDIEDAAEIANAITATQLVYEAGKWASGKIKNGGWFGNKLGNYEALQSNGVNPFTGNSFEEIVGELNNMANIYRYDNHIIIGLFYLDSKSLLTMQHGVSFSTSSRPVQEQHVAKTQNTNTHIYTHTYKHTHTHIRQHTHTSYLHLCPSLLRTQSISPMFP
jgi:hypothetical protein